MKKALSLMLVLAMLMSIMPAPVFSEEFFEEESFASGDAFESFDAFEEDFFAEEPDDSDEATVDEVQADEQLEEETVADAAEVAEPVPEEQEALDEETQVEEAEDTANQPATEEAVSVTVYASVKEGVILYKDAELTEAYGTVSEDSVVEIKDKLTNATGDIFAVSCVINDVKTEVFLSVAEAELLPAEEAVLVVSPVVSLAVTEEQVEEEAETEEEDSIPEEEVSAFTASIVLLKADAPVYANIETEETIGVLHEGSAVLANELISVSLGDDTAKDYYSVNFTAEGIDYAGLLDFEVAEVVADETVEPNAVFTVTEIVESASLVDRAIITGLEIIDTKSVFDTSTGTGDVYVRWLPDFSTNLDHYEIRWSKVKDDVSSSSCSLKDSVNSDHYENPSEEDYVYYEVSGLSADTWYFSVVPVNTSGNPISTACPAVSWAVSPAAPKNFRAIPVAGETGAVTLKWKDSTDADGYVVYNGEKQIFDANDPAKTEFKVTGLTIGNTYSFKVYAYYDKDGSGSYTKNDVLSHGYAVITYVVAPPTPKNIKAKSESTTSIKVSWDTVTGVSGYRVYYKQGNEVGIGEGEYDGYMDAAKASTASKIISDLTQTFKYAFIVCSYIETVEEDEFGNKTSYYVFSEPSEIVTETCIPAIIPNGKASYDHTTKTITITWKKPEDETLSSYVVYMGDDTTSVSSWQTPAAAVSSATLDINSHPGGIDPEVGHTYYFKVTGVFGSTEGNVDDAELFWVTVYPDQPLKFKALNGAYDESNKAATAELSWKEVDDADGYIYQRSTKNNFAAAYTYESNPPVTPGTQTTATDSPLKVGTTYYYRICAYVDGPGGTKVQGPWSDVVSLKGSTEDPAFDKTTTAALTSPKQYCGIVANWNAVAGADGYYISVINLTTGKIVGKEQKIVGGANTTYTFTGLTAGEQYDLIVKSYKGTGISSGFSWKVNGEQPPIVPTLYAPDPLKAESVNNTSLKIAWDKVYGVKGYRIHVEADLTGALKDTSFTAFDKETTSTSYTISNLKTGYPYIVRVSVYSDAQNTRIYSDDNDTYKNLVGGDTVYIVDPHPDGYTEIVATPKPNKPTSLKATVQYDQSNDPYVQLTWSSTGELVNGGFRITRSDGTTVMVKDTAYRDDTTYLTDAMIGKTLGYQVESYINPLASSDPADFIYSDKTDAVSVVLKMNAPVVVMDNTDTGEIKVTWKQIWGAESYEIYHSTTKKFSKAVKFATVADDGSASYEQVDAAPLNPKVGKANYYYVVAIKGDQRYESSAGTGKVSGKPPKNLAIAVDTDHSVDKLYARRVVLTWDEPDTGKPSGGYVIYAKTDGSDEWKKVGTAGKKATTKEITKLLYQQDYTFAITAKYAGSSESTKAILDDDDTPHVTTELTTLWDLKITNTNTSALKWTKVPDATGYVVVVADPDDSSKVSVYTTSSNKYTVKGLEAGKQYPLYVYPYIKYNGINYWLSKQNDKNPENWDPSLSAYFPLVAGLSAHPDGAQFVYVGPKATSSVSVTMSTDGSKSYVYASWKAVTVANQAIKYKAELIGPDGETVVETADGLSQTKFRFGEGSYTVPSGTKMKVRVTPYYESLGDRYDGASKTTGFKKTK